MKIRFLALLLASLVATGAVNSQVPTPNSQQRPNPQPPTSNLKAAIDNLGRFEAPVRTAASRDVRWAPAAQAVPALMEAAAGHADGYVRFRALVLLSGFNDARAREVV